MPKKEAAPTPKQKAYSDAKVKQETAQKAHDTKPTPATETALKAANDLVNSTYAAVKRENFVRVGGNRVTKAIVAIRNLGNVNNLRTYTYTEADIAIAEKKINDRVAATLAAMREGLSRRPSAATVTEEAIFSE